MTARPVAMPLLQAAYAKATRLRRFLVHVSLRFHTDGCFAAAGALSYTTLVSLVPLLVIALAVLSAFPLFQQLRDRLLGIVFDNFVPEVGSTVEFYISQFTASAGKTTAVGLVVFATTGILLLATIEDRLNAIWKAHAPRSWITRLLVYWTVTTLGPFLLAATISISEEISAFRQKLGFSGSLGHAMDILLGELGVAIPVGAETLGLVGLYCLIPHCPVRWRDALAGGIVSAVLLEISKAVFTIYLGHFHSYQMIYGALAAVPIFLLWMYLSWTIILFGAEIAAAAPHWVTEAEQRVPPADNIELALAILDVLAKQRRAGGGRSLTVLCRQLRVPAGVVADCLDRLAQAGWAVCGIGGGWVLARDLDASTLGDLAGALRGHNSGTAPVMPLASWHHRLAERYEPVRRAEERAQDTPISDILGLVPEK